MEHQLGLGGFTKAHERVLGHARRLATAVPENDVALADAARSFLAFWQGDASILLRKEEEVLLPVLARHGGNLGEPVMQMLVQHAVIRGLVMELSDEAMRAEVRSETLLNLKTRLEDHVRLEEQVVLPVIKQSLSGHALEEAASRLEAFEVGGPPAEPWVPTGSLSFDPYPGPGDSEGGGWD